MQYTKRSIIYFIGDQDEQIYVLQQGHVILAGTDIETGKPVVEQVQPGEFFGIKPALGHFPREETATVMVDSLVIALSVSEFEQVFTSNKPLILKMLKVFSAQLRTLHRKTESILNSSVSVDQVSGMFEVAKSFYDDSQYTACGTICEKLLEAFPNTPDKNAVMALCKDSKLRTKKLGDIQKKQETETPQSQFDLPAFDRFAKQYEAGSVIIVEYEMGETFYLIISGLVQSVKCVNGIKKNLDIHKPGEFFGEMAILENTPRSATCVALTKVNVLEFTKENFELLITGNPQMAVVLLKLFCKRIHDQERRFKILCISDVSIRVADVLLMFDEMTPNPNPLDKKRSFDLTIYDIAHWAGIPVDVAKTEIKKYCDSHQLEVFDTYITITNISDIRRIVEAKIFLRRSGTGK
ncbi:MAG: Crp/Fnr family transcriptional regulator [Treponema sp.]|jgi:CRP-like cAMP-binding protein|nr:Crp/Fnr family transcriptional regulator [Treponema sp.]